MFRNGPGGDFNMANMWSLREHDDRFPFSPYLERSVKRGTLPKSDLQHAEPPFEVLTALNYGRILEGHGSHGSIADRIKTPLAPPPEGSIDNEEEARRYADEVVAYARAEAENHVGTSRFIQATETPWKCVTPSDWQWEMGWSDFVPPGMTTTSFNAEQEFSFRPRFENATFPRRDQQFYGERKDPRGDTEAREFVTATGQDRI